MTKSSIVSAVSRIERAPNVSAVVRAYDAAVGGSDVFVHRHQGAWQIWSGEASGFCGDFSEIRAHLARDAEEVLERAAEEAAQAPAMVPQPAQLQQACAARTAPARLSRDELLLRIRKADGQYAEVAAEIERKGGVNGPSRLDAWLLDGPRASGAELRAQLAELDRVATENPPAQGFRVVKCWVDDADVFQTLTFTRIYERAEDATGEIVSLLGGRDPKLFSAAEREAGALLTMEQVGPAPAMVAQPVQQQQACAARQPRLIGYELTKRWLDEQGVLREDAWPCLFGKPEDAAPLRDKLLAGQGDPSFFGASHVAYGAFLSIEPVYL